MEKMIRGVSVSVDVTPPSWRGSTAACIGAGIAAAILAFPVGYVTADRGRLEMQVTVPDEPMSPEALRALRDKMRETIARAMDEARRIEDGKYPPRA